MTPVYRPEEQSWIIPLIVMGSSASLAAFEKRIIKTPLTWTSGIIYVIFYVIFARGHTFDKLPSTFGSNSSARVGILTEK